MHDPAGMTVRRCLAAAAGLLALLAAFVGVGVDAAIQSCRAERDAAERTTGYLSAWLAQEKERAEMADTLAAMKLAECRREYP